MCSRRLADAIDTILGKPYSRNGTGPDRFSCRGVVIWLYGEVYGRRIPDPVEGGRLVNVAKFAGEFDRVENVAQRRAGDFVLLRRRIGSDQHMAFVESPEWVVEADQEAGVVRTRFEDLKGQMSLWRLRC